MLSSQVKLFKWLEEPSGETYGVKLIRMKNKGQSLVEYGLILALCAVVCISGLRLLGNSIFTQISELSGTITRASEITVAKASSPGSANSPVAINGGGAMAPGGAGQNTGLSDSPSASPTAVEQPSTPAPAPSLGSDTVAPSQGASTMEPVPSTGPVASAGENGSSSEGSSSSGAVNLGCSPNAANNYCIAPDNQFGF
jgi:Flp pilus assembly pilin Flp